MSGRSSIAIWSIVFLFVAPARALADDVKVVPLIRGVGGGYLDGKLPASGDFDVTIELEKEAIDPTLRVWPQEISPCDQPAGLNERQVYLIPMTVTISGEKGVAKARVPHLQVDEVFCFRVTWKIAATPIADPLRLEAIATAVDADFSAEKAKELALQLLATSKQGFCGGPAPDGSPLPSCPEVDTGALGRELWAVSGDWIKANADVERLRAQVEEMKTLRERQKTLFAELPLSRVKGADNSPVIKADFLSTGATVAAVDAAIAALKANDVTGTPAEKNRIERWLLRWKALLQKQDAINKDAIRAIEAKDAALVAFGTKSATIAVEYFKKRLRVERIETLALSARTTDHSNYISPETGIAVVAPLVSGSEPALLPYVAANFYFCPVERSLPLEQLVNSFCQRFSLSVGLSLSTDLDVAEVEMGPTFGGKFALVGAGYRILPFARVAALLFLADAKRKGGLSANSHLVGAAGFGLSADLDVVAFLAKELSK